MAEGHRAAARSVLDRREHAGTLAQKVAVNNATNILVATLADEMMGEFGERPDG
jgi:hypothetical protein